MPTFQAVIARYREDVSWAKRLSMPFVVYNKGDSATGLEADYLVLNRPNVGRESETYIHHIIENYDTLPDYTAFIQGNPFDHCPALIEILAGMRDPGCVVPLSINLKRETLLLGYNWENFTECLLEMSSALGIPKTATVRYGAGAQYLVPRDAIVARPKSFYEWLLSRVSKEVNPLEGWVLERLWPHIFGVLNKSDMFGYVMIVLPALGELTDTVRKDAAVSLERAMAYSRTKREDIDFTVEIATSAADARARAIKAGNDLVCFIDPGMFFEETALMELLLEYYVFKKERLPGDSDLLLGLVKDEGQEVYPYFMTHRDILLQHDVVFGTVDAFPDARKLALKRQIPFFTPRGTSDEKK